MQAILRLIEAADHLDDKKQRGINVTSTSSDSVSKKEGSSDDNNDYKITAAATAVDDMSASNHHREQNMKGIVEEVNNDESINDIACLAALHVSVATFIKIVFEEENLSRF